MQFALIHQPPGASATPAGALLWRTCIRDVIFLADRAAVSDDTPVISNADAYALLVEIVAGLRSPLVGETEVQAQFKQFLSALDPASHAAIQRLGQRVLADAKTIRHEHLQGLSAHSYGALAVTHVAADSRVVIVGTGALAADIVAAIGPTRIVDRWGRRAQESLPALRLFSDARAGSFAADGAVTIILAAPVGRDDLSVVLGQYPGVAKVIDLRSVDERTPVPIAVPVVTLEHLFAQAPKSHGAAATRVTSAREAILKLAQAYLGREEMRPFGWDDLCA